MAPAVIVLRVQPVSRKKGGLKALQRHDFRKQKDEADLRSSTRSAIDPARSQQNKILLGSGNYMADYQTATEGIPDAYKNSDSIGAVFHISASPEFFQGKSEIAIKIWAEDAVEALKELHQKQNKGVVISAVLHLDETTPHVSAISVPIIESTRRVKTSQKDDQGKNIYAEKSCGKKINYNAAWGDRFENLKKWRKEKTSDKNSKLGRLQTDYTILMVSHGHNLDRGKRNSRESKHLTVEEWQDLQSKENATLRKELVKLQQEHKKIEIFSEKAKGKCIKLKKVDMNLTTRLLGDPSAAQLEADQQVLNHEASLRHMAENRAEMNLSRAVGAEKAVRDMEGEKRSLEAEKREAERRLQTFYDEVEQVTGLKPSQVAGRAKEKRKEEEEKQKMKDQEEVAERVRREAEDTKRNIENKQASRRAMETAYDYEEEERGPRLR